VGHRRLDQPRLRSFLHNDEVNAVILGPEFGAQMQAMFDVDLAASRRSQLEKWAQRPLGDRVKELAARVWEYWL
jgi:cardiolipin synthase